MQLFVFLLKKWSNNDDVRTRPVHGVPVGVSRLLCIPFQRPPIGFTAGRGTFFFYFTEFVGYAPSLGVSEYGTVLSVKWSLACF